MKESNKFKKNEWIWEGKKGKKNERNKKEQRNVRFKILHRDAILWRLLFFFLLVSSLHFFPLCISHHSITSTEISSSSHYSPPRYLRRSVISLWQSSFWTHLIFISRSTLMFLFSLFFSYSLYFAPYSTFSLSFPFLSLFFSFLPFPLLFLFIFIFPFLLFCFVLLFSLISFYLSSHPSLPFSATYQSTSPVALHLVGKSSAVMTNTVERGPQDMKKKVSAYISSHPPVR